jgi:hypothetical protein
MPIINFVQILTSLSAVGTPPLNYIPIAAIPVDNGDAPFAEAAKTYSSTAAMLADGFLATSDAVLAVAQVFGQGAFTPTVPTRVAIVKRAVPVAQVEEFTVLNDDDGPWTLSISYVGGSAVTAATFAASGDTVTAIKDGLLASFVGGAFAPTQTAVTSGVDSGTVTAVTAGAPFILTATGPNGAADVLVANVTPNAGLYEDLDAGFKAAPFWCVIPDPAQTQSEMIEVSRWAEASAEPLSTRRNICMVATDDADILTATEPNFAATLAGMNRTRTFVLYHVNLTDKMTAAWFGRYGAPTTPGERAFHFGLLSGTTETTAINYVHAQGVNLKASRCSWVERDGPASTSPLRVFWGQGSGGFFAVQKQAEDYWWLRTIAAMVAVLESVAGVNLDDEGVAKMVSAIDVVNTELGTSTPPVIDLAQTSVTPVPLEDVPPDELQVGDYQTTGGINVATKLIPKGRSVRVSAVFST